MLLYSDLPSNLITGHRSGTLVEKARRNEAAALGGRRSKVNASIREESYFFFLALASLFRTPTRTSFFISAIGSFSFKGKRMVAVAVLYFLNSFA
jgi:hypothetical protein